MRIPFDPSHSAEAVRSSSLVVAVRRNRTTATIRSPRAKETDIATTHQDSGQLELWPTETTFKAEVEASKSPSPPAETLPRATRQRPSPRRRTSAQPPEP